MSKLKQLRQILIKNSRVLSEEKRAEWMLFIDYLEELERKIDGKG